jgi:predicted 3-demethylubiquinone-9 3-methyltransferase (glyoxalase superfamily)
MQKISPFLWFDSQAEDAANLYVSLFEDAEITDVARYPDGSPVGTPGEVMTVSFRLAGQEFTALNGGEQPFSFNESVSFVVTCEDQDEVDRYWTALTEGGGEPGPCGWLKDRFGLSWQIVPKRLNELLADPDPARVQATWQAMLEMGKLEIKALEDAADAA